MFGSISLILQDILIAIVIFLTSFLPSNPENLVVDASAITSQSVEMVFECENKTRCLVDRPTVLEISEKTDEGWKLFFENRMIIEEPDYILPGGTGRLRIPVEYYYGKPTLDPGEYKVKITYRVHEADEEVKYVTVEVPFTVE